jgi:hypothetical protein
MKKNHYLIYVLLLIANLSFGQKWDTIYGNPGTSEGFKDVIECYDKGYLVSGSSFENLQANWLIKIDINKNVLWEKLITWDDVYVVKSNVDQDLNGNFVLASLVSGESTGQWPRITKLDSCGEKVWCRVYQDYDNYNYGWFKDVLVLDNGDILALGELDSEEEIEKIFLWYIESNGDLKWRQGYASQNNYPHIRETNCDGIRKYGDNYIIHGHCYYPYPSDTTHFFQRPLFIMLDSMFNEQWVLPFGVNDSIIGKAFHTISLNDSVYLGVGVRRLEGVKQNSLIMYFNNLGEELGYAQIPNEAIEPGLISNLIHDIARINDTLFLASVNYGYENTTIYPWGEMILDTAGNIYDYTIRSNSTTGWSSMVKTFDNKYTVGCSWDEGDGNYDIYLYKINENLEQDTIYPGLYTYDSLCPYQIQSGEIDISDCLIITDVGEIPSPKEYYSSLQTIFVKAYPNPVNGNEVTFEFQNTEHLSPPYPPQGGTQPHLRIYNVFGELVHEEKVYQHQGESKVNIDNWNPGIYVALVYSKGHVVGQCKFVVSQ